LRFGGGGERIALSIARGLMSKGLSVRVYFNKAYSGPVRLSQDYVQKYGVQISEEHMKTWDPITSFLTQPLPNREILDKARVNIIFIWRLPLFNQLKYLLTSDRKIILALHGIGLDNINITSNKIVLLYQIYMRLLLYINKKWLLNKNLYFQVLNNIQRKILINQGVSSDKIFLIHNGIDFTKYSVKRNDEIFQVLFISRMEDSQKGIKLLLHTTMKLKESLNHIRVVAIGSGPDSKILTKDPNVIECRGYVDENEKISLLSTSSLLLITSYLEPFSLSALEGLASGLPIVSTPVAGPREIISQHEIFGKISNTYRADELVSNIKYFYNLWENDKDKYFKNKITRREIASRIFNEDKMINGYLNMIKRAIEN
jgi:glycosyltransferase involved in cell wall biosynthesis